MLVRLILVGFFLTLTGCISSPRIPEGPQAVSNEELHALLGLSEEVYDLGFKQHRYNPCDVGVKPLEAGRCASEYYSTVHIQLLCRKTSGTIQEVGPEYALYDSELRWKVDDLTGEASLDEDGFGLIRMRTKHSPRKKRIRIISGNDFLVMRIADIKKVLVPAAWCN